MNAQQMQQGGEGNFTLTQLNELLNSAGLAVIRPDQAQALQQAGPRDTIIRAAKAASSDPTARQYITDLFTKVGIIASGQPPQDSTYGAPGPTPQHSASNGPQRGTAEAPSNQGARGPAGNENGRVNPEDRVNFHVYGGKAALCFETDMTKNNVPTVALDAATASAPRQFDWANKTRLQLTRAELPEVAAVFMGIKGGCKFQNHGPDSSKGFEIERQPQRGGTIFVKVFAKQQPVKAVPVMPADAFYVTALLIRQLQKAMPWLDTPGVIALIRSSQTPF